MITRDQSELMRTLRDRGDAVFSNSNDSEMDVIKELRKKGEYSDRTTLLAKLKPITKALYFAAYSTQQKIKLRNKMGKPTSNTIKTNEDALALIEMLKANPLLLTETGNIITPNNVYLEGITVYECLLGVGDTEIVASIAPIFSEITDGERERNRQHERYRPDINAVAEEIKNNQPRFDVKPLIERCVETFDEKMLDSFIADALYERENREYREKLYNNISKSLDQITNKPLHKKESRLHFEYDATASQLLKIIVDLAEKIRLAAHSDKDKKEVVLENARTCIKYAYAVDLYEHMVSFGFSALMSIKPPSCSSKPAILMSRSEEINTMINTQWAIDSIKAKYEAWQDLCNHNSPRPSM